MRHFLSMLKALVTEHPVLFVLVVIVPTVLLLGGVVWKLIGFVFRVLKKVPVAGGVASAAENAVNKAAAATGSA